MKITVDIEDVSPHEILKQIAQEYIYNSEITKDLLQYLKEQIDARLAAMTDKQLVDRLYLLAKDIFTTFERKTQ